MFVPAEAKMMDAGDKALLNALQDSWEFVPRPYALIAAKMGISEDEVLARVKRLKAAGNIRRIGAVFSGERLGFVGTLCAAKVCGDDIERVAGIINSYRHVTHNYLRSHEYNMWFTLSAASESELQRIIEEIKTRTGLPDIISLRAKRVFKLDARFPV